MPKHEHRGERLKAGKRLSGDSGKTVTFEFEGEAIAAREGEPVAVALLAAGVDVFSRSSKYHRPRGPYCLGGRCSHCLMRVDGEPNVPTCTAPVRDGMKVERQNAFPSASLDVFEAIDWMYPKGLDHHSMFAGIPVVETVASKVARHLSGLGKLPDAVHGQPATVLEHVTDVAVVGAGPAGLAAASAAAGAGARTLLVEEQEALGGRLAVGLAGDLDSAWAEQTAAALRAAGGTALLGAFAFGGYLHERGPVLAGGAERTAAALRAAGGTTLPGAFAFGVYLDERGPVLAVQAERRIVLVRFRALVVANGGSEPPVAFENNDLPGIYAGRGLARMIHRHRVLPGRRAVVVGTGPDGVAVANLLAEEGVEVVGLVGPKDPPGHAHRRIGDEVLEAKGHHHVSALVIRAADGRDVSVDCDLVAIAREPAPMFELARQAGSFVRWDDAEGTFRLAITGDGQTSAPFVFACGEVVGPCSAAEAAVQGEKTGRRAAAFAAEARA